MAFLRAENALASGALLPRAFCAHGRRLIHLLYQQEADCASASVASGEQIARPHQHIVSRPMRLVDDLIYSALLAEYTRKKIVSGTGVFHKESPG